MPRADSSVHQTATPNEHTKPTSSQLCNIKKGCDDPNCTSCPGDLDDQDAGKRAAGNRQQGAAEYRNRDALLRQSSKPRVESEASDWRIGPPLVITVTAALPGFGNIIFIRRSQ